MLAVEVVDESGSCVVLVGAAVILVTGEVEYDEDDAKVVVGTNTILRSKRSGSAKTSDRNDIVQDMCEANTIERSQ